MFPSPAQTYLSAWFFLSSRCSESYCSDLPLLPENEHPPGSVPITPEAILPSSRNHTYSTALHLAARHNHITTVNLLIHLLRGSQDKIPLPDLTKLWDSQLPAGGLLPLPGWLTPPIHASGYAKSYPLSDALDSTVPLACVCASRHLRSQRTACGILDWPIATPLMVSIANSHTDIAKALISAGAEWQLSPMPASAGSISTNGTTPVHMMVANGMEDLLEWLVHWHCREQRLTQGANPPFLDFLDDDGHSALGYSMFADAQHQRRLEALLQSLGADSITKGTSSLNNIRAKLRSHYSLAYSHREQAAEYLVDLGKRLRHNKSSEMPIHQPTHLIPPVHMLFDPHCEDSVWCWVPGAVLRWFQVCHRMPLAAFRQRLCVDSPEVLGGPIHAQGSPQDMMQANAALQARWWEYVAINLWNMLEDFD